MSILEPPPRDNRQRRHSTKTMQTARQMYDGGWTPTQIREYFADKGIKVSLHTIRLWVIPGMAEEHRAKNVESYHRRQAERVSNLDRVRVLKRAGLSCSAVGIVMGLYHGLPLTENQVRYSLEAGVAPKRGRSS